MLLVCLLLSFTSLPFTVNAKWAARGGRWRHGVGFPYCVRSDVTDRGFPAWRQRAAAAERRSEERSELRRLHGTFSAASPGRRKTRGPLTAARTPAERSRPRPGTEGLFLPTVYRFKQQAEERSRRIAPVGEIQSWAGWVLCELCDWGVMDLIGSTLSVHNIGTRDCGLFQQENP